VKNESPFKRPTGPKSTKYANQNKKDAFKKPEKNENKGKKTERTHKNEPI